MDRNKRDSFSVFQCSCGNPVSIDGQTCGQCEGEIYQESDGHSRRSGRKDNSDTWVMRLEDGFDLIGLSYDDDGED